MMPVSESVKSQIRLLSMITYSMMFGQLLFTAVGYFTIGNQAVSIPDAQEATNLAGGSFIVATIAVMLANRFLKYKLGRLQISNNTQEKDFKQHRTAYIIYLAILEAAGLMGIICFLLTAKALALGAPCMSVVQMFLHRPTEKKVTYLLG